MKQILFSAMILCISIGCIGWATGGWENSPLFGKVRVDDAIYMTSSPSKLYMKDSNGNCHTFNFATDNSAVLTAVTCP